MMREYLSTSNCSKEMKRIRKIIAVLLVLTVIIPVTGCSKNSDTLDENSLTGTWEYSDEENGIGAVYDLKDDGTGTYTMKVGDQEVIYELKYEANDGHLFVTYVNNDLFTENDVFDNEFSFKDTDILIIKDSFGEELTFVRK